MNTLVLMAGPDDAFREAGFQYPKNLTEIEGLPLVEHVARNLAPVRERGGRFICCVRRDENERHHTAQVIRLLVPEAIVVEIGATTGGAACTALLAAQWIDTDEPLLITNGDQLIDADLSAITQGFDARGLDGGIVVFQAVHPRWSYARVDEHGLVVETAEKRPISRFATAGTYYFSRGAEFVRGAMAMIRKDAHVNGAFYICPAYNEMILEQKQIGIHEIPRDAYVSLATPDGVRSYEALRRAAHAAGSAH